MLTPTLVTATKEGCVESWWDPHTRSYVTQRKDRNGFQVGSAEYSGTRTGRDFDHDYMVRLANKSFENQERLNVLRGEEI